MNNMERDVYVLTNTYKEPIEMVQGTNGIPLIFYFRDYDIPTGTTASVFVQKPSGKAIQDVGIVNASDDTVTVDTTAQMTAEVGDVLIQIQLKNGGSDVFTFNYPMLVSMSVTPINSESGSSFIDEYLERIEDATLAAETVTEEIITKAQNGEFSATVNIGETVTGIPGTTASVSNSGTAQNVILDFTIPAGIKGDSGVMAPASGFFALWIDSETGNLYCDYADGDTPPQFELEDNGDLYMVIEGGAA